MQYIAFFLKFVPLSLRSTENHVILMYKQCVSYFFPFIFLFFFSLFFFFNRLATKLHDSPWWISSKRYTVNRKNLCILFNKKILILIKIRVYTEFIFVIHRVIRNKMIKSRIIKIHRIISYNNFKFENFLCLSKIS